jgi:ERF superfamily
MTAPPDTTGTPELNKALAAFQASLPTIAKEADAQYGKYADLTGVSEETLPSLGKHGLALTGFPGTDREGRLVYDYTLLHESGQERSGSFPLWLLLPDRFNAQHIGGYITYVRRYILGAVTGVAPGGEDNDAAEVSKPERTRTKIPGPDHERLQPRRQPGDRPAERGPIPPEDDMWAGSPAGPPLTLPPPSNEPGSADGKQIRDISVQLNTLGITDHEEQLARIERIINGPLDGPETADDGTHRTRKNLSKAEAITVRAVLAEDIKAMKLAERAKAEQDAAAEVGAP